MFKKKYLNMEQKNSGLINISTIITKETFEILKPTRNVLYFATQYHEKKIASLTCYKNFFLGQ